MPSSYIHGINSCAREVGHRFDGLDEVLWKVAWVDLGANLTYTKHCLGVPIRVQ
jgi:hypothetical protein